MQSQINKKTFMQKEIQTLQKTYTSTQLSIIQNTTLIQIDFIHKFSVKTELYITFIINIKPPSNTLIFVSNSVVSQKKLSKKLLSKIESKLYEIHKHQNKNSMTILQTLSYCSNEVNINNILFISDNINNPNNVNPIATDQKTNNNDYYQDDYYYNEPYDDPMQYDYHLDDYDDYDWDPKSNKKIITTFSTDKKKKHKIDPFVKACKNTIKRVNNQYKWNYNQNKPQKYWNIYGVIVINGKELYIGTICGRQIKELYSKKNRIQLRKHNKGGQSAPRFGRMHDNKINAFVKDSAIKINKCFYRNSYNGIILAGNGPMKSKLYQSSFLKSYIKASINIVNVEYGGKIGFNEIYQKFQNNSLFKQQNYSKSNQNDKIIEDVMFLVNDNNQCNMISIGINETIKAIKLKIIKYIVLLSNYYKYVIKRKPIQFIKNDIELHTVTQRLSISNINTNKKHNKLIIVEFMNYFKNLCRSNGVKLKIVENNSNISRKFANDLSGCIGVLYQPFNILDKL